MDTLTNSPAWRLFTWTFVAGQAAALAAAGLATLWWSEDLMTWLIWMVGEEYALGAENVVRKEDGTTLLTNPGAMTLWTLPFLLLALLQLSAAATLIWYRWRSDGTVGVETPRTPEPRNHPHPARHPAHVVIVPGSPDSV